MANTIPSLSSQSERAKNTIYTGLVIRFGGTKRDPSFPGPSPIKMTGRAEKLLKQSKIRGEVCHVAHDEIAMKCLSRDIR